MTAASVATDWVSSFDDPMLVFKASATVLGLGQILVTLEYLAVRREFDRGGIYPWSTIRLNRRSRPRWVRGPRDAAFSPPGTDILLGIRLALAVLLAVGSSVAWIAGPAVVAFALVLLVFNARLPWGRDSSDNMALHVTLGLSAFAMCRAFDAPSLGLYYIAAYAGLAYCTAGITKLVEPAWRDGEALQWVMNLESFGAPWAVDVLAPRPHLRALLSRLTVLAEVGAPLVILLPAPALVVALLMALAFHLVLALTMGLNAFVWSFLATYPAVLFVWTTVHT